jgi:hypothetical protein
MGGSGMIMPSASAGKGMAMATTMIKGNSSANLGRRIVILHWLICPKDEAEGR